MAVSKLALTAFVAGGVLAASALVGSPASAAPRAAAGTACPAPAQLAFSEPTYVDKARAGGEPLVATYPSGRLLYSAHAGTTHFFTPEVTGPGTGSFYENYTGQTYFWTSDDNGKTWTFRPRIAPGEGAPASGFSDPEIAIDSKGNIFFSEINLANVAVSKSADKGSTFSLQNFGGAVLTDRQWMEADRPDELYFVANGQPGGTGIPPGAVNGHYIAKSTDGGKTFTSSVSDQVGGAGVGDIRVDKRTGTVYETHVTGGKLSMAAFRNARAGDLKATDTNLIADNVHMLAHWPAFDLDPSGNLYVTWDEDGKGDREAGIWMATSTNGGRAWSTPVRVNNNDHTAIWPWLGVGDDGRVGLAWLEADKKLPNHDAETEGTHGWRIVGAITTSGLGCATSKTPSFSVATATKEPLHTGTICQGGTTCQAFLIDRRLGDYFSVDVDGTGRMYVGYSDTRIPGSVSLPGFVRQSGGASLLRPTATGGKAPTATTGQPAKPVPASGTPRGGTLPTTGAGAQLPAAGGLLLLGALLAVRARRRSA
jgi:LPXTG-motif cell wall-anchored protein